MFCLLFSSSALFSVFCFVSLSSLILPPPILLSDSSSLRPGAMYKTAIRACPEVVKPFPCSTQLSTKFIRLINVKMPTIVGILTFISMINTISERLEAIHFRIFSCRCFSFYEQLLKFRAQLS